MDIRGEQSSACSVNCEKIRTDNVEDPLHDALELGFEIAAFIRYDDMLAMPRPRILRRLQ